MSKEAALDNYAKAVSALERHKEQNSTVFEDHQELVFRVIDAENLLRDEVAMAKSGVENNEYNVTCTPETQTFGDIEEIDKLVAAKLISPEIRAKIVKTVDRPARITIKKK